MTTEEKANAYDEALKRAKNLENTTTEEDSLIRYILPELTESEDERIRKIIHVALISSEDELSDFYKAHKISRKECTDWLEKQKEQKPVDWNDELEKCKKYPLYFYDKYVKIKLKPTEWSEEDEVRKESCILYLANARDCIEFNQHIGNNARESAMREIQKDIDWLKYHLHQPNTQWSEEDEEMLNTIIADVSRTLPYCGIGTDEHQIRSKAIRFLRSLRPQSKEELAKMLKDEYNKGKEIGEREGYTKGYNKGFKEAEYDKVPHWKPSEEQMEAFRVYLYHPQYINDSEDIKIKLVESLYNDLKKL